MSPTPNAVFLSYASQDADAARKICEALRAAGVEVWFDQSELRGGDAWDQKIRRQIKECALFVPIVSANTQARSEGYFRLEWKLADDRTHLKARGAPFLLPVCIDDTKDWDAIVPESFTIVQWVRLSGGATSTAFCERVKALLGGPEVVVARAFQRVEERENTRWKARATLAHLHPRRWIVPALVGSAAILALAIWQPWKRPSLAIGPAPATALSKARQLAAQADLLFDQDERSSRENAALAENLCAQAVALDPNDAEVWAVHSRVHSYFIYQTYDRSPERNAKADDAATRAMRLAPKSFEARYARSYFYRLDDATYREAEAILRQLLEERPDERRVWRTLGRTLRSGTIFADKWRGRDEEAIECFRRAAALPGGDPLALGVLATTLGARGRLDEAEKAINDAIALKQHGSAYSNKMNIMLRYGGDVAKAREALGHIPAEQLREDRDAFIAAEVWLCSRQPDQAIETLRLIPRDYMEAAFDGPKGALVGQAHQQAGRPQAAQVEWRAALQVVDRRLAAQSNNVRLLVWRAWLLAHLGDGVEARRLLDTAEQLGLSARDAYTAAATSLQMGDRSKTVAFLTDALQVPVIATPAFLRINPAWDALRGDPGFEALVAETKTPKSQGDLKSIAVLAFKNLSNEKDNDAFSDGITDELTNLLGKVPGLRVAGSTSAFSFKGKGDTVQEIGRKLGVGYIVEGTVKKAAGHVRITAKLIGAADGFTVWQSDTVERELKDIWAVQDEIAGVIAQNLKLKLGAAARPAKTVNPEAHGLLLVGRHHWGLRTFEDFARAETAFSQAVALDPQFAQAHAGLADNAVMRATYRQLDGEIEVADDIRRTRQEVQRALALEPALAEAHTALAYALLLERKLPAAEAEYQQALALNPNYPTVHTWRGVLKFREGRLDLAIEEFEKATTLDPLAPISLHMWSEALSLAGRVDEALAMNARAAAQRSEVWLPDLGDKVMLLWQKGRKEEAVDAARSVRALWPKKVRWFADAHAIWVLQQAGLQSEAADYAAQLLKDLPATSSHRGLVLTAVGRFEEAVPYLERAGVMTDRSLFWSPMWDPLRETPRFQQLIVKLGCAAEYKVARETLAQMLKEQPAKK